MISTRGRYALRVMIDLAENGGGSWISLKEIAGRQQISPKYLESIVAILTKGGLIEGAHGKLGGYRLTKSPEEYRVGAVLRLTEGSLAPVKCLESGQEPCARAETCKTLPLWERLDQLIAAYLDGITLRDLMEGRVQEPK